MDYSRAEVPELENLLKYGKKKFVRYDEGAKLYSMGLHSFQELVNITLRRSRLSGVARATIPDKQSHLVTNYCTMF